MKNNQTPKEYIESVENQLYKYLQETNYKKLPIQTFENDEQKAKRYFKIIISILYKQLYLNDESNEEYNGIIKYIIEELEKAINDNNSKRVYILFENYSTYIINEIKKYLNRKEQNYILRKLPYQRINELKRKEIIKNNPFVFQECYEAYKNPLTQEEQYIGEILEMKNQVQKGDIVQNLLIEMANKYEDTKFNEVIIFIICNAYQNAMETGNTKILNLTKNCVENLQITNKSILDYFIEKKSDHIMIKNELIYIIQSFLYFNEKIEEGKLKNFEQQSSYVYVKQRLKKPN